MRMRMRITACTHDTQRRRGRATHTTHPTARHSTALLHPPPPPHTHTLAQRTCPAWLRSTWLLRYVTLSSTSLDSGTLAASGPLAMPCGGVCFAVRVRVRCVCACCVCVCVSGRVCTRR
jgi:hypothetical protein